MKLRGLAQVALVGAMVAAPLAAEQKGCCRTGSCCGKDSGCCSKASERCAKDNAKCLNDAMAKCCGKAAAKKAKSGEEVASVDSQILFEAYKQQLTQQPK
jgi:hypothetical protein